MRSSNRLFPLAASVVLALSACRAQEAAAPESEERQESERHGVSISTESQAAIGLKVEVLREASMPEVMTVVGRVLQDAQTCHHIPASAGGRLSSAAAELGQRVAKGMELAVIKDRGGKETPVLSGHDGVVTAAHAVPGDPVDEGAFLFSVTEIDPLWGVLDIHERSLARIRVGQKVEIRTAAYPAAVFHGKITFVSPEIDSVTRTVKARIAIANPDGRLKLGMFLDASVLMDSGGRGLFVPRGAVQAGPDGSMVFIQTGPAEFRPAKVSLGREQGEWVQVVDGLKAGDAVVVTGAFLVKSEMLRGQLEGHGH